MKQILLVEDDPFTIDIYTTKFKEVGFEVEVATNGDECLTKLKNQKPPDLIILDIVLPQFDGFEVLKKIKNEENFKKIPVIILSNLGQKEEVERGLSLGAEKYLIKAHHTPSQIVEEIRKIIK